MSAPQVTHFADDATLAHILKLEADLAAARREISDSVSQETYENSFQRANENARRANELQHSLQCFRDANKSLKAAFDEERDMVDRIWAALGVDPEADGDKTIEEVIAAGRQYAIALREFAERIEANATTMANDAEQGAASRSMWTICAEDAREVLSSGPNLVEGPNATNTDDALTMEIPK